MDGYASFLDMPVKDGTVIISARSKGGNAYITHAPLGGPNGRFTSGCIPRDYELDNPSKDPSSPKDPLARIELSMAADAVAFAPESLRSWVRTPVRGTTTITRHGTGTLTHERTYLPRWVLALSICVLVCGLYGSILGVRRLGRLASIGVSLGITVGAIVMLGVIVSAYLYIISVYRDGGIVMQTSVGYLTRETFHDNIPADWIFSLSLPSREGDEKHIVGFGAPLWAILLGSIGACITAFQHLVRTPFDLEEATSETAQATDAANAGSPLEAAESAVAPAESDPPPVKDSTPPAESDAPPAENDSAEDDSPPENSKVPAPAQAGDSNLSKDRFSEQNALTGAKADQLLSIAFAPLGSIFVYQALILLDFTEFVIIATIMLASGLSLNILVSIAFQRARSIIHAAIVKADPASRS